MINAVIISKALGLLKNKTNEINYNLEFEVSFIKLLIKKVYFAFNFLSCNCNKQLEPHSILNKVFVETVKSHFS